MKWQPIAIGVLLVLVAFTSIQYGRADAKNRQALIDLHSAQHLADSERVIIDSQTILISVTQAKVDTLRIRSTVYISIADTQQHKADSLVLLAGPDTAVACRVIREAYDARTTECAELRKAVDLKDQAIQAGQSQLSSSLSAFNLLKNRNDSLSAVLGRIPPAYTCKILFLPCPSRTVTFLLGGGLGFLAGRR